MIMDGVKFEKKKVKSPSNINKTNTYLSPITGTIVWS